MKRDGARQGCKITRLGRDLFVISVPDRSTPRDFSRFGLSPAEEAVAKLADEGLSNAAIAEERGSTARTVANQLASVYSKLGVSGRRDFRARLRTLEGVNGKGAHDGTGRNPKRI